MDDTCELFPGLETERLRLRCVRPADAAGLSAMMTHAVSRWVAAWPVPFTVGMATERIATMRLACTEGRSLPCAIERRRDGVLLGTLTVARREASDRRAMLGYWLGEAHQGHGYMREAAPAIVRLAFRMFDLDSIEAAAQPGNAASFAILRRCGMAPAGERMILAPARGRDELCLVYEVARTSLHPAEG